MELLRNLLEIYVFIGFLFLAFTTIMALVLNRNHVFEHPLFFVLCCVFTWPRCIYSGLRDGT